MATKKVDNYKQPDLVINNDNSTVEKKASRLGEKFLAVCLIIGGMTGIFMSIMSFSSEPVLMIFLLIYFLISFWHIWKGIDLWKGKSSGYLWGKILFAFQIPLITSNYIIYNNFSGALIALELANQTAKLNVRFGGGFYLYFSDEIQQIPLSIGINIFAIIALIYLIKRNRGITV